MSRRIPEGMRLQQGALDLDLITLLAAANSIILAYFIFTQVIDQDVGLGVKTLFAPILMVSGVMLGSAVRGRLSVHWQYTVQDFVKIAGGTAVATMSIALLSTAIYNLKATAQLSAVSFGATELKLFYMNMAVAEELFFNFFIFTLMLVIFRKWLPEPLAVAMALAMVAGFFAPYHIGVYGTDLSLFAFTAVSRVILSLVFYLTKNLSAAAIPHMIINAMVVS